VCSVYSFIAVVIVKIHKINVCHYFFYSIFLENNSLVKCVLGGASDIYDAMLQNELSLILADIP
jgi:hypothetical protein